MAILKEEILGLLNSKEESHLISRKIDSLLGINHALESTNTHPDAYSDGETSGDALYTDYQDLYLIKNEIEKRGLKSFLDCGAGISRSKILFDLLKVEFATETLEFVKERVDASREVYNKLNLPTPEKIRQFDFNDLKLNNELSCDAAFLYLPVSVALFRLLLSLKCHYLFVIESHGDLVPFLEKVLPGLQKEGTIKLHGKRHDPDLHLFKWKQESQFTKKMKKFYQELREVSSLSFAHFNHQERIHLWMILHLIQQDCLIDIQFEIDDGNPYGPWLASLKESLLGLDSDSIEFKFPPRVIPLASMRGFQLPTGLHKELCISREENPYGPRSIRKIFIHDEGLCELANGEVTKRETR